MRRIAASAIMAVLISLGMIISGSSAQADQFYSRRLTWLPQAYAICTNFPTSTTGSWKVAITCKNVLNSSAYREGPWVRGNGNASWATCPTGYTVSSHRYLRG